VAIAVRDDADWQALAGAIGCPDLPRDAREEVETTLAAWTAAREPDEIEATLQACGVPVHAALDTTDLFGCPQLHAREHFIETGHEIFPATTIESSRLRLSRSAAKRPEQALSLGRDNREVLASILGYGEERIDALLASGAVG
jgi:crotonobetainyl-CoA:carnitine CoA-transferase CaiB-like acyl-CoA transferase